jgi:hypothetical protein
MKEDIAIEEIRAVRRRISAAFGHDTGALLEHYRELEHKYADRIMSLEASAAAHKPTQPSPTRSRARGKSSKRCA